ncbi:MAG: Dps family protein [Alphaproteobacteria bacterium]
MNALLADSFALFVKTKNFHWHVSGPHFRIYHLLFDEYAEQIFKTTDELAERVRKIGGTTLHSVGEIAKLQRIKDNDAAFVTPFDMLRELMEDNKSVMVAMRETHALCEERGDVATASLLEIFVDGAEERNWFLFERSRKFDPTCH